MQMDFGEGVGEGSDQGDPVGKGDGGVVSSLDQNGGCTLVNGGGESCDQLIRGQGISRLFIAPESTKGTTGLTNIGMVWIGVEDPGDLVAGVVLGTSDVRQTHEFSQRP